MMPSQISLFNFSASLASSLPVDSHSKEQLSPPPTGRCKKLHNKMQGCEGCFFVYWVFNILRISVISHARKPASLLSSHFHFSQRGKMPAVSELWVPIAGYNCWLTKSTPPFLTQTKCYQNLKNSRILKWNITEIFLVIHSGSEVSSSSLKVPDMLLWLHSVQNA